MKEKPKYLLMLMVLTIGAIALNYFLWQFHWVYVDGQMISMEKATSIAMDISSGEKSLSTDQMAELVLALADRTPELYGLKWWYLFSAISVTTVFYAPFLGFVMGRRNEQRESSK